MLLENFQSQFILKVPETDNELVIGRYCPLLWQGARSKYFGPLLAIRSKKRLVWVCLEMRKRNSALSSWLRSESNLFARRPDSYTLSRSTLKSNNSNLTHNHAAPPPRTARFASSDSSNFLLCMGKSIADFSSAFFLRGFQHNLRIEHQWEWEFDDC
jgi:hypothetical protein